jgi:tetratricopeptide (TPR) repeat protein
MSRYAEAQTLQSRALAISEKALGPDHPSVASGLCELASTYRELGRYEEAEPLLSRALSIREKALGSDHPLTKYAREALDTLRSKQ